MDEKALAARFAELDKDNSGFITVKELLDGMPELDRKKAESVLAVMDVDGDGHISYEEFVSFWREQEKDGGADSRPADPGADEL